MPSLLYQRRLRPLFALFIVLIPATLGGAVPQDVVETNNVGIDTDLSTLPIGDDTLPVSSGTSTQLNANSIGDTVQGTGTAEGNETSTEPIVQGTGTAAVPENSAPLQLEGFPVRPSFENTTRIEDRKNYTDRDAPIVASFKKSSELTTYHIQDKEIFVFFSTAANFAGSEPISADNATSDAIDFAMPRILEQLDVDSKEIAPIVEEASPIFTEALMHLLGQSDMPTRTENDTLMSNDTLTKRKSKCCKQHTRKFKGQKPSPGIPVTESHMYFLLQLYGYFPQTANLRLHFNTRKFLGFIGEYDAITFARDIFIVDDYRLSPKPGPSDFFFERTMSTIIHEVRHSQQYRSIRWSIHAFGLKYLYQFCKAGFSYRMLQWEAEAYAQDVLMAKLLADRKGFTFFQYWQKRRLFSQLGILWG
ncbi:MAG: hypothetical protein Q9226_004205 [Calogaya cf. arnoldii]